MEKEMEKQKVGFWLGLLIFLVPVPCSLILLKSKYSNTARAIAFIWVMFYALALIANPPGDMQPVAEAPRKAPEFTDGSQLCLPMADAFSLKGKQTELQLRKAFRGMKGRLFEYKMRVTAVEVTMGMVTLHALCAGRPPGAFETQDFLMTADRSQRAELEDVNMGDEILVCGKFTDFTRVTGMHGKLVRLGGCDR